MNARWWTGVGHILGSELLVYFLGLHYFDVWEWWAYVRVLDFATIVGCLVLDFGLGLECWSLLGVDII